MNARDGQGGGRRTLRFGIDATCLGSGRGYGRFLRELLPPLAALAAGRCELLLFADDATAAGVALPDLPLVRLRTSESQARAASATGSRQALDLLRMGRGVARTPLDAFFFPSVYSYFPIPGRVPIALAIHDTIPERHGAIVFPDARTRWLWRVKSWLARHQARTVITVSEFAKRQLVETFRLDPAAVRVVPEAPSPVFQPPADPDAGHAWRAARGLPRAPYLLYVGGFNPHKNVLGLVRAFARLGPDGEGRLPHLVLVGDHQNDVFHGNVVAIRCEIESSRLQRRVHWAGFVPDAELVGLYASAVALVLPSLEEGFGLPAVEAAACGAPCIATTESPLPELLAGGGRFVRPRDSRALSDAMATLLARPDERAALGAEALRQVAKLSWDEAARATLEALEATAHTRLQRALPARAARDAA